MSRLVILKMVAGDGRRRACLFTALGLLAAGCATVQTTAPGAIGIQRRQQMLVSEQEVAGAAQAAYAQEIQKARSSGQLNSEPALLARVRRVSQRLIPVTAVFRPEAPAWPWEVNVQATPEVNAYCMPGGKIMVYSGLVDKLALSDAELAAVVGHEMAHALREHTRERMSRARAEDLLLTGVAVLTGLGQLGTELVGEVANVTFQLPHSREQEAEADEIGLELMARAGYDPHAAVHLWQKMAANAQSELPQFLSTHPSGESRIADLEARVPVVLPLYQAAQH